MMAKGRILTRRVGESAKVDRLWSECGPEAALLWTWLIPWIDINGNLRGKAMWFLSNVVPAAADREAITLGQVREYLAKMEELGLLERYEVDGRAFYHVPGFHDEQIHLRRDREQPEVPDSPSRNGPAPQQIMQRRTAAPHSSAAQQRRTGEPTLAELLQRPALDQEWWDGHTTKSVAIGWWLEALDLGQHPRPPEPSIARMGKVAERLAQRHTRAELAQAIYGMTRLFPWAARDVEPKSPHRSWDLMTLEKSFTEAHAAAQQAARGGGQAIEEAFGS